MTILVEQLFQYNKKALDICTKKKKKKGKKESFGYVTISSMS